MAGFKGGCLCGDIRYEVKSDPVLIVNCHCDDCRKATGSQFATNLFINEDDLVITQGEPKSFNHSADSGNDMTKMFCPNCGSQLFGYGSGRPGLRSVKAGTVEDHDIVNPQRNIYTSRALKCTVMSDEIENFETMAT